MSLSYYKHVKKNTYYDVSMLLMSTAFSNLALFTIPTVLCPHNFNPYSLMAASEEIPCLDL
jgi:hypothetical protein